MNGPKSYLCSICLQNLNECSLARAPQIFAFLASSQSKFFISARAHKKIAVLGMLANARKDHSSPLKEVWPYMYSRTLLHRHPLNTDTSLTMTVFFAPGESHYIFLHSTQLIRTPVNADDGPR